MNARLLAGVLALVGFGFAAQAGPPPNILFILSDDHSYPFVGCYGDSNVKTPTLDHFASQG